MRKLYTFIVKHRRMVIILFLAAALICVPMKNAVSVNYDINDYLPEECASSIALDVMEEEFDSGIPNARVMVSDVSIAEALAYKAAIEDVEGVTSVTWLDDSADLTIPLSVLDTDTVETYYVDGSALFSVTIEEDYTLSAVNEIRDIIGEENAMTGSAVSTAAATTNTVSEIAKVAVIAVLFVLLVLLITTSAWTEPVLILASLGVAILINSGTNLIFGEISFVTNAAGSVLQMAVSLDYAVFLLHRFEESRLESADPEDAMIDAMCKSTSSILSSGLTTVIGFLALILMQFRIGPDLGLALAKGVAVSLITTFTFLPALTLAALPLTDRTVHRKLVPDFKKFGAFVTRICVPMAVVFAVVLVPSYLASNANDYYYGSSHMFGTESQTGSDTAAIEAVFGENDTYVLLVPNGDLAVQEELSEALHDLDGVTDIISYVDQAGASIPTEYLDEDTLALLMSENYSRFVISVDVPYEGEETFALVEAIRETANEYYPDAWYLAGEGVSTYDLMETVTDDMLKINFVVIAAVFLVLLLTMKSLILPVILVLSIETAIWLNLSCPYFMGVPVFYIAYLIISSVQLGATVDYAILTTDRYLECRRTMDKKTSVVETIRHCTISVLTSGSVFIVVGALMSRFCSNQLLAQLGLFIGRGGFFSLLIVLFVLPGLLYVFDGLVIREHGKNLKTIRQRKEQTAAPEKRKRTGRRAF